MKPAKSGELVQVVCKCGAFFWTSSGAKRCQSCVNAANKTRAENKKRKERAAGQLSLFGGEHAGN